MTAKRGQLAQRRRAAGYSQEQLAERLGIERSTVSRWERGETEPLPWVRPDLARLLSVSTNELERLLGGSDDNETASGDVVAAGDRDSAQAARPSDSIGQLDLWSVEQLRRRLHNSLSENAMASASLDDWEQTILRHGSAARNLAPSTLLAHLIADLADLQPVYTRCRSSSALRRLTRVTAQLAGLICLTLIKLDERTAFRRWARTARVAADEAEDSATLSWVYAQEAYGYYYSSELTEALAVARHAQAVVGRSPGVGAVLAAALEARAHAATRNQRDTELALGRAELILSDLDVESVIPSAFGYNEAQLRFHEGNAYTHLGDTPAAWRAQQRALELCPLSDYMDRSLMHLDRASCLIRDGDVEGAMATATETLLCLTDEQRQGIILRRSHELLVGLPQRHQALPAATDFRDLLMQCN